MVRNSLQTSNHVDFESMDLGKVRAWLEKEKVPADFDLPGSLRKVPLHGCKVVEWHGHKVTLLCLMPNGNGHADLFVLDCTRFGDFTLSEAAQFAKADGISIAVWRRGAKTYLLTGAMDEQQLRNLL